MPAFETSPSAGDPAGPPNAAPGDVWVDVATDAQAALAQPAPTVLPLRLPQRHGGQVRAANRVLQRAHRLPVSVAGQDWLLTLTPRAPGAEEAQAASSASDAPGPQGSPATSIPPDTWCLSLFWGDAPLWLRLPGSAAQAWLGTLFPGLDLPALPEAFAAGVMETAVRGALAPLAEAGHEDLRLLRIERDGPATHEQEESWQVQLECASARITGWLSTTPKGLVRLATGLQDWGPATGPLATPQLPLVLRAEVGFTWMRVAEWAALRPGDAILVDRPLLAPDGELWLACGEAGLRARPAGEQLLVTSPWRQGGAAVDRYEDEDPGLDTWDGLRQLPLRVVFDVGELHLTLGELETLQVGQALDLGRPLSEAVQVRVNGARVGLGELVDIDGRLGVVLRSLSARDLGPLADEDPLGFPLAPPDASLPEA